MCSCAHTQTLKICCTIPDLPSLGHASVQWQGRWGPCPWGTCWSLCGGRRCSPGCTAALQLSSSPWHWSAACEMPAFPTPNADRGKQSVSLKMSVSLQQFFFFLGGGGGPNPLKALSFIEMTRSMTSYNYCAMHSLSLSLSLSLSQFTLLNCFN